VEKTRKARDEGQGGPDSGDDDDEKKPSPKGGGPGPSRKRELEGGEVVFEVVAEE
jgi:hypothetical protein